eukprot:6479964-Amphidinium_carterae.1
MSSEVEFSFWGLLHAGIGLQITWQTALKHAVCTCRWHAQQSSASLRRRRCLMGRTPANAPSE